MPLPPNDAGIRLAVGLSGAGKTAGVKADVLRAADSLPIMVLDRMHEWGQVPPRLQGRTRGFHDVQSAAAWLATGKGGRLAIVRPKEIEQAAEDACAWARDYDGLAGVAIPEAHRVAPNGGRLPPALDDVATAWRHHRVALWLDTQRLAQLHKTLTEQARELRIYAVVGDRDIATVRSIGGGGLVSAVTTCCERLAQGEAGWHVSLGLVRVPPFQPTRERM